MLLISFVFPPHISTEVMKSCILPISQFSEESQEVRNKECRRFREHHTRTQLCISTKIDLSNMLLITTDPVINSFREMHAKFLKITNFFFFGIYEQSVAYFLNAKPLELMGLFLLG